MTETDDLLNKITSITTEIDNCATVILGGSRARNEHQHNSDIDVLIISQKKGLILSLRNYSVSNWRLK